MAKDFLSNLIKHEEQFNFSSLESFLSSKYTATNQKFVCKYCGFVGKKSTSLSAHMRFCKKKPNIFEQQKNLELSVTTE